MSALLLLCALFSGHLLAHRQGHDYFPVQSLEQQLLHEADSDELRSQCEEGAALPVASRWIRLLCASAGSSSAHPG